MKRMLLVSLLATLALCMAGVVFAGSLDNARVALHRKANTTKAATVCGTWEPADVDCANYALQVPAGPSLVYLVVGFADTGVKGVSCGIEYSENGSIGLAYVAWTLCADGLQFPNNGGNGEWPANLGGNRITWNTCSRIKLRTASRQLPVRSTCTATARMGTFPSRRIGTSPFPS